MMQTRKGFIRIDTPAGSRQMNLHTAAPEEVYDKSRQLKERIALNPDIPFVVWMQVPSRMNAPLPVGSKE